MNIENHEGPSGDLVPRSSSWPSSYDAPFEYRAEAAGEESGLDLSAIGSMLWRRKWTILVAAFLVTAVVATITYLTPKTYESSASVLVDRQDRRGGSALEVLEGVGRTATPMETEVNLVRSRRVIEPVVESLLLHIRVETDQGEIGPHEAFTSFEAKQEVEPGFYRVEEREGGGFAVFEDETDSLVARSKGTGGSATFAFGGMTVEVSEDDPGVGGVIRAASFPHVVSGVQGRVSVAPVQAEADLFRINCRGSSAKGTQVLCQSITDEYLDLRTELQRSEAIAAAEFLQEQAEQVRERLAAAENALGEYQANNQAVALPQRAAAGVQQYATLEAQRTQLEAERTALNRLIEQIDRPGSVSGARNLASFPSFLTNRSQAMAQLFGTLVTLEDKRSELAVTRSDQNPDVMAVDARIEEVESQLKSYAQTYERGLTEQISALNTAVGRAQGQLSQIPARQVETTQLQRQVENLAGLYNYLQTRLREAEVAKEVNLPSVKIVDRASLPLFPSSPNVRMNLALGLLLGMAFGVMIALYREYADSRIRERGEVEHHTGIPVLGMIPSIKRAGPVLPVLRDGEPVLPSGTDRSRRRELKKAHSERGESNKIWKTKNEEIAYEAFRSLLTDLKFAGRRPGNGKVRTVAITGAGRGDGKTFTACNLAIVSASQRERTLLIDGDLRASGVARFMDLPWTAPGFTDVLGGSAREHEVQKTLDVGELSELQVMTAGTPTSQSIGLLERQATEVRSVLDYAERAFDLVIVDTPPLNVISDAAVIVSQVDVVLVVVRGGVTDRSGLDLTLERLRRLNARVAGIVLNDVDLPEYYTTYSQGHSEAES